MPQGSPAYPNMNAYPMSYQTSQPQLPPIQAHQSHQPGGYMSQHYRPEPPRYPPSSAAPYGSDRYSMPQQQQQQQQPPPPQGVQGSNLLPQPGQQYQPSHTYTPPSSVAGSYPQRIAPAPPRDSNPTGAPGYGPPDGRAGWPGSEGLAPPDTSKYQPTHVVGSQGRRGILPSAPGRPGAVPNGANGTAKNAIPPKDADGKFPCPNCNKTYLHAKHLKRHLLRHTGDRPYMCVLCKDTFSRSDILKRHFQKCSVRRGNPTGASHLSNPAAHVKKHQAAQRKAAAEVAAAAAVAGNSGANTPNSGVNPSYPNTSSSISNAPNYSEGQSIPYSMAGTASGDMHRAASTEQFHPSGNTGGWNQFSNAKHNPMLYQSTASPDHFAVNASHADEKRAGMTSQGHHPGEEWHAMFPSNDNSGYMNTMFPSSIAPGYESMHAHSDVKPDAHGAQSNPYYMPNSMGSDGQSQPANYKIAPNVEGWTVRDAIKIGTIASGFGVAAGTFALFFFGEIPRVRKDILSKVPIFGDYWVREIAPEDNPF
ncbi:putative c2h2 transcription factor [Phaeomoniella chlamydospora]|uniref:Putative c2h2 transcription factor n=1 Tax=Phaeomoniella chlamydospora TaxID=158046 RepID=A0A0G2GQV7_PHACM|nr:putative c2h2 transcription factor [Phaeomoniella chlamydospora]